jgi:hypothetical protein
MQSNERPCGKEEQPTGRSRRTMNSCSLLWSQTIDAARPLGRNRLGRVALRFGVYEYFHGDGRILRGLSELL